MKFSRKCVETAYKEAIVSVIRVVVAAIVSVISVAVSVVKVAVG